MALAWRVDTHAASMITEPSCLTRWLACFCEFLEKKQETRSHLTGQRREQTQAINHMAVSGVAVSRRVITLYCNLPIILDSHDVLTRIPLAAQLASRRYGFPDLEAQPDCRAGGSRVLAFP